MLSRENLASLIMPLSSARAKNNERASMIGTWMTRKTPIRATPLKKSRIGQCADVVVEAG